MTDRFSGEWTVEIVWGGIWDPALVPGRFPDDQVFELLLRG